MIPPDLDQLNRLAARVGADGTLVQGAGGNVSLKDSGVLWIKASGTWLAHACDKHIMVPVALDKLTDALSTGDPAAEACLPFVRADLNPHGLRPSIETSVHGLMPQRIVVHVHSVDTIAWAICADARAALKGPLDGLRWRFVPYVKPGLNLARAMAREGAPDADVVVLGNHGLVVCGDTVEQTAALLDTVVARLRRPVRVPHASNRAHLDRLSVETEYRLPEDEAMHGIGTDPVALRAASIGSLYPDHVIFLGPGIVALRDGETVPEACARAQRPAVPLIVVPGAGVLLHTSATAGTLALTRCLADVTARVHEDDTLRPLSDADEAALLDWDAEKYRQTLDRVAP